MLFCISKTKNNELAHTEKPSPLVGEGVNRQVDGRGKCEQIYIHKYSDNVFLIYWNKC